MIYFPGETAPDYVKGGWFLVTIVEGKVETVEITTTGIHSQQVVLAALTGKFGKPARRYITKATTLAGVTVQVLHARWQLGVATIAFDGAVDSLDRGKIVASTPAGAAAWKAFIDNYDAGKARL